MITQGSDNIGRKIEMKIGRNCVVNSYIKEEAYPQKVVEDGESLFPNGETSWFSGCLISGCKKVSGFLIKKLFIFTTWYGMYRAL